MSEAYSGKFVLRLPQSLHQKLSEGAREQGLSLNQFCLENLARIEPLTTSDSPLVQALKSFFFPEKVLAVYLYGSAARGEATAHSDLDVLCVLPSSAQIQRRLYHQWDSYQERQNLPKNLSLQLVRVLENTTAAGGLWLELALDGFPLYDPDRQVHQILLQLRKLIAEGFYERRHYHGQPVWTVRKEGKSA